jgi:hypothetical protein
MAFSTQDKVPTWDAVEEWLHNAALKFYANSAYAKEALGDATMLSLMVSSSAASSSQCGERETGAAQQSVHHHFQASRFVQVGISALWACASLLASDSAILEAKWPTCAALRLEPVSRL